MWHLGHVSIWRCDRQETKQYDGFWLGTMRYFNITILGITIRVLFWVSHPASVCLWSLNAQSGTRTGTFSKFDYQMNSYSTFTLVLICAKSNLKGTGSGYIKQSYVQTLKCHPSGEFNINVMNLLTQVFTKQATVCSIQGSTNPKNLWQKYDSVSI